MFVKETRIAAIFTILLLIFYFVVNKFYFILKAVYFVFFAYREFKALALENNIPNPYAIGAGAGQGYY
jgi:hypothetical protein